MSESPNGGDVIQCGQGDTSVAWLGETKTGPSQEALSNGRGEPLREWKGLN